MYSVELCTCVILNRDYCERLLSRVLHDLELYRKTGLKMYTIIEIHVIIYVANPIHNT